MDSLSSFKCILDGAYLNLLDGQRFRYATIKNQEPPPLNKPIYGLFEKCGNNSFILISWVLE
ncbi:MAG: hypothetical protein MJ224_02650 [archaeon]|nr:hypothetical protein [archaeon]